MLNNNKRLIRDVKRMKTNTRFRNGKFVVWYDWSRRVNNKTPYEFSKRIYSKTWWWINKIHKQAFKWKKYKPKTSTTQKTSYTKPNNKRNLVQRNSKKRTSNILKHHLFKHPNTKKLLDQFFFTNTISKNKAKIKITYKINGF